MPNWSGGARLPHRYWPSKGRQRHGGGGSLKAILRGISTYKNPGSMGWPVGIRNHVLLRYLLFFFGAFRLVYTEKPERTMLGLEWRCRAPAPLLVPTPVPPRYARMCQKPRARLQLSRITATFYRSFSEPLGS